MNDERLVYVPILLIALAFTTIPLHIVWLGWILVVVAIVVAWRVPWQARRARRRK